MYHGLQPMHSSEPNKIPIRAVVFDYGNVLSFHHLPSDVEAMAAVCGISVDRFNPPYWGLRMAYDRDDLDSETYWSAVARTGGRVLAREQIEKLIEIDSLGWSRLNPAAMAWVEQIRRAGFRLALLSNMPADISRYLTENFEWPSLFDHLIFSCDVRSAKPEPEIYQACLRELQLAATDVLFFDDRQENVDGAAALGLHGILFDGLEPAMKRVSGRFDIPLVQIGATGPTQTGEPLLDEM